MPRFDASMWHFCCVIHAPMGTTWKRGMCSHTYAVYTRYTVPFLAKVVFQDSSSLSLAARVADWGGVWLRLDSRRVAFSYNIAGC